jgi:hypothetical protein
MKVVEYTKLYSDPAIDKHIIAAGEKYNEHMEKMIGVGLNMPFECTNSAARKNMFSSQYQQHVCLVEPEIPYISTGYENKFGQHSSSYVTTDRRWHVIARIEKFSRNPGHHYYLIVIDDNNNMDVIERVSYNHNTETYGFLYDNTNIDNHATVGAVIEKNTPIKKSKSFDEYGNFRCGKNLRTMYVADPRTTEDAIEISQSAARALARTEIKLVTILINDNDIPLNLYGDDKVYKFIPDIGEEVRGGILCGSRTERNDESFYTQSVERLRIPMINDTTFKSKGKVVDINVYCNKDIATSNNGIYEGQLAYYANDHKRFCTEFVEAMKSYINNTDYVKSYALSQMYCTCLDVVEGKQYFKDNAFSNIIVEVVLYREAPLEEGDKVTSRHGGKGVISKVIADEMMPLVHGTDKRVDLIWNMATCVNRVNPGQLFETSLNFIAENIVDFIKLNVVPVEECIEMIHTFYNKISPTFAKEFIENIEGSWNSNCCCGYLGEESAVMTTVSSFFTEDDDGLYMVLEPISESITLDKLIELYGEYPWITPVFLDVPIVGSNGRVRYVCSKKPSIVAKQYIYRMKQNAEEKHSATSMSATNVRNMNSKSKASKMFIRIHSNTPIRFGEMEGSIFKLMGAEIDATNMMLYSNSPIGRRDAKQLLTSYRFNVQLSEDAKSRSAEMVNAIIKTMGVRFVFNKIPIKYDDPAKVTTNDLLFVPADKLEQRLFAPADKLEQKLFVSADKLEQMLFAPADKLEQKLFVPRKEIKNE